MNFLVVLTACVAVRETFFEILLGYSLRKVFITSVQAANALNARKILTPKNETIAALSCKNGKADLADGTEVSHPKFLFHNISPNIQHYNNLPGIQYFNIWQISPLRYFANFTPSDVFMLHPQVTIETPNYPENYPNKAKCSWKIG